MIRWLKTDCKYLFIVRSNHSVWKMKNNKYQWISTKNTWKCVAVIHVTVLCWNMQWYTQRTSTKPGGSQTMKCNTVLFQVCVIVLIILIDVTLKHAVTWLMSTSELRGSLLQHETGFFYKICFRPKDARAITLPSVVFDCFKSGCALAYR